jgi:hypothetical protein
MPGLFDMMQPQDPLGQPTGFGNALTSRGNAMIGMGMGLLSPYRAYAGESPYTNALQGWQTGSAADLASARTQQQAQMERARLALAQSEAGRQAEQWKQEFGLRQKQFERGGETEAERAARLVLPPDATEEQRREFYKTYLLPKTEGDWKPGSVKDPRTQVEYPYLLNPRTGEYRWGPLGPPPGAGQRATAPATPNTGPTAPVVPGTTLYWPGQEQPSTTGAATGATRSMDYPPDFDTWPFAAQQAFEVERAKKLATEGIKSPQQEAAAKQSASDVLTALDRAEQLATNKGGMLPTTGILGGAVSQVYQPSKDLAATLDTIKANVSLDKLTAMRQSSTTGASGLGAVTESEHKLLQASIAALDQSQSPEQFMANLRRVRATYDWIVNRTSPNQPPPFSLQPSAGPRPTTTGGAGGGGASGVTRWGRDANGKPVPLP